MKNKNNSGSDKASYVTNNRSGIKNCVPDRANSPFICLLKLRLKFRSLNSSNIKRGIRVYLKQFNMGP